NSKTVLLPVSFKQHRHCFRCFLVHTLPFRSFQNEYATRANRAAYKPAKASSHFTKNTSMGGCGIRLKSLSSLPVLFQLLKDCSELASCLGGVRGLGGRGGFRRPVPIPIIG